jgi:LAS superfamily LD-carboxypeptidase LdcB
LGLIILILVGLVVWDICSSSNGEIPAEENAVMEPTKAPLSREIDSYTYLVNKSYPLPADYVPVDLVEVNAPYDNCNYPYLRADAAVAYEQMVVDAANEGINLFFCGGYRSYDG